jgi:hypothetical protein
LGILGTNVLLLVGSLAAIVLGHLALHEIRHAAGRLSGRGLAIAGAVLGYAVVIASLVAAIVVLIVMIARRDDFDPQAPPPVVPAAQSEPDGPSGDAAATHDWPRSLVPRAAFAKIPARRAPWAFRLTIQTLVVEEWA